MAPSKEYMLERALRELEAVLSHNEMSPSEVRTAVQIAAHEVRNVLAQLANEGKPN